MIDQPIEEAKLDLFEVQFQKNGEQYCVMLLRGDFSKWISVLRFDGFEWVEFKPNHLESYWISDKLKLMGFGIGFDSLYKPICDNDDFNDILKKNKDLIFELAKKEGIEIGY